jgi:hypothetical protein
LDGNPFSETRPPFKPHELQIAEDLGLEPHHFEWIFLKNGGQLNT